MSDSPWTSWRNAFSVVIESTPLGENLKQAALDGILGQWTIDLTAAVVKACEANGWEAAARRNSSDRLPVGRGEYLSLDVVALPRSEQNAPTWPFPLAVFELENSKHEAKVAYSLWKVLCVRAPLRVVFAYGRDWPQSRDLVDTLQTAVIGPLSPAERESIGGETIVVVGNRGEGETFPWGYFKAWRLDANLGRFEKS